MNEELAKQIEEAFSKEIEPVETTFLYKLGLFVVSVVMLLLPVIYVSIIAVIGFGLFYHATHSTVVFKEMNARFGAVLYFAPLIAGCVLIFYMIKPLIPRFGKRPDPLYTITRENEPGLYLLVEKVCEAVDAPFPKRIDIMMEANACASFRRGLLSFIKGDDLVLTIGLPLISTMSVQQIAGVIAHEMGHFSQGAGMRFSYIIESINDWFVQAVYGGHSLDDKLSEAAGSTGGMLALMLLLTKLFIFLTRTVLYFLMMLGYLISNFLSRQMEFDADLNEIRVSGSTSFESSTYTLSVAGLASENVYIISMLTRRFQLMSEDLPGLIRLRGKEMLAKHKDDIINTVLEPDTRLFDTHPSQKDRIAHAKRQQEAGICKIKAAASVLFKDFSKLSKSLTQRFYLDVLGPESSTMKLMPADQYLKHFNDNLDKYHPQTRKVAV